MESIERRVVRTVMGLYIESEKEVGMCSSVKINKRQRGRQT